MEKGVNLLGYINGAFSLGVVARNIHNLLQYAKIPHNLNEIISPLSKREDFLPVTEDRNYDTNIIVVQPDILAITDMSVMKGRRNIAVWFWELDVIPDYWAKWSLQFDEIWVQSSFVQETLMKHLPNANIRLVTIPHKEPERLDKLGCRNLLKLPEKPLIFLFIFDYYSDGLRKNPEGIIKAFKLAFKEKEDVRLIIKYRNGTLDDVKNLHDLAGGDSRIEFWGNYLPDEKLNQLMNACDVYVSLHRSEGLGFTIMEAMYLEKSVIATGYSGNMDFCKKFFCRLVGFDLVPLPAESIYVSMHKMNGASWAEPSISDAAYEMRGEYEHRHISSAMATYGRNSLLGQYNKELASETIKQELGWE